MPEYKSLEFDTWLLQSVILANSDGKGTSEKILTAADLLSKTPMPEADLGTGLARLIQMGLVQDNQWYYSTTGSVPSGLRWTERDKIRELLSIQMQGEQVAKPAKAGDYVKRFQGFMSGLTKPKKN
jgi:hypothetical protein